MDVDVYEHEHAVYVCELLHKNIKQCAAKWKDPYSVKRADYRQTEGWRKCEKRQGKRGKPGKIDKAVQSGSECMCIMCECRWMKMEEERDGKRKPEQRNRRTTSQKSCVEEISIGKKNTEIFSTGNLVWVLSPHPQPAYIVLICNL